MFVMTSAGDIVNLSEIKVVKVERMNNGPTRVYAKNGSFEPLYEGDEATCKAKIMELARAMKAGEGFFDFSGRV